jgi:hypothetical protein
LLIDDCNIKITNRESTIGNNIEAGV